RVHPHRPRQRGGLHDVAYSADGPRHADDWRHGRLHDVLVLLLRDARAGEGRGVAWGRGQRVAQHGPVPGGMRTGDSPRETPRPLALDRLLRMHLLVAVLLEDL